MPLDAEQKIQIWERAIQTQMHFAELSIKMRQIGLTLAGATIALAILMYRTGENYSFQIPWTEHLLPVGTILCISAAMILFAARLIDVGVYHRTLRGAVRFNELYEENLDKDVGWKTGLTETISAYSRFKDPELLPERDKGGRKCRDRKSGSLASNKINTFYYLSIFALLIAGFALALVENLGGVVSQ